MFMAMMSAIQCNPIFKAKYEQLVADGKPKKIALRNKDLITS
jgi:transposase